MKSNLKYKFNKKPKAVSSREVIAEPARRSIADVVETNLKIAKRVTYLHRLIYIGQYYFSDNNNIVDAMDKNYKQSNSGYCTESLSGILLYYPRYFCYIVEGSEEVLHKHLNLLMEQSEGSIFNIKLLSAIHHIKGRFWNEWMSYYGRPPERVEEIDPESDLENSMRYVTECCEKLYRFANRFISDQLKLRMKYMRKQSDQDQTSDSYEEDDTDSSAQDASGAGFVRSKSIVERDTYSDDLPELKLLDFLINCKHCKEITQYYRYFKYIGQSADYSLKVWPTPTTIVPYDVFDKPYDPIEDLPPAEGEPEGIIIEVPIDETMERISLGSMASKITTHTTATNVTNVTNVTAGTK